MRSGAQRAQSDCHLKPNCINIVKREVRSAVQHSPWTQSCTLQRDVTNTNYFTARYDPRDTPSIRCPRDRTRRYTRNTLKPNAEQWSGGTTICSPIGPKLAIELEENPCVSCL